MKRRAGWRPIAFAALLLALMVATACSQRSAPVASIPTAKRTVDQTATLVGTWVPRTTVKLVNRGRPPVLESVRLEGDGRMFVRMSSSAAAAATATGSWSLIPPYGVWLKLDTSAKPRWGAYLLGAHPSYLRLTAVEGDTWATGVDTSTVFYDRQR